MVRVNIVNPRLLSDQHLIAEYLEILMLVGGIKKDFDISKIPKNYVLGKGHINFFKNKLGYLKKRHELLRKEMKSRGFKTNKKLVISKLPKKFCCDWTPKKEDYVIIKERLLWKIGLKPEWYRYYGEIRDLEFYNKLLM